MDFHVPYTPAFFLLHQTPMLVKVYKKSMVRVVCKVEDIQYMKSLTVALKKRTEEKFNRTWFYWLEYS